MEKQDDMSGSQPGEIPRNELVLDNWKLVLIFFVGLIICTIFFAAGLIVGRHQPRVAEAVPEASINTLRTLTTYPPTTQVQEPQRGAARSPQGTTVVEIDQGSRPSTEAGEEFVPASAGLGVPGAPTDSSPATGADAAEQPSAGAVSSPASRPPSAVGSMFRVQVAAMKSQPEAQAVVEKLRKKGFESFIVPPSDPGDGYFRVQMGDFADRPAAQELILRLQQAGERPVLKRQ